MEVDRGIGGVVVPCKTCGGYGYLLCKGNYITYEMFQQMLQKEESERFRILFKVLWYLGLKNMEALSIKIKDINLPGDAERLAKYGIPVGSVDVIRVWRKKGRFRPLPLPKWLKEEILEYARKWNIKDDQLFFDRHRTSVYYQLAKHGYSVGGKTKINSDTVRRGFGIWYLSEGGHLEDLQLIYDHSVITLTQNYLAIDGRRAIQNFVNFQKAHSPEAPEPRKVGVPERKKRELLDILGGPKCSKCTESDIRLLEFDHIEGGGKTEVLKFGTNAQMVSFYVQNPELARQRLQVLCVKHNRLKKHENKEFVRFW
jgi:hypothetical protein